MSAIFKDPATGLRPMQEEDIDKVMAVESEVYPYPWTPGIFRDCLHVGYSCWVYEEQGEIQAYSVMSLGVGEAHILTLCVRPLVQRQGYGRMMMQHMLNVAKKRHVQTVLLEVRPSNRPAIMLYKSLGFREVGVRREYYPADEGREDALIMALDL